MSTIIVTATEMACDGMGTTSWDRVETLSSKKIIQVGNVLYGFTGSSGLKQAIIDWHSKGAAIPGDCPNLKDDDASWTLIVVTREGAAVYTSAVPYRRPIDIPYGIGSGGDYALAAVLAGADARRAIEIASRLNTNTGGEIQVVNIAEALRSPIRKRRSSVSQQCFT